MRSVEIVLLLAIWATTFTACQKADIIDNAILVKVRHNGTAVAQAGIYIKKDTSSDPGIELSKYDYRRSGDARGEAYFSHLLPGKYYLCAHGFCTASQQDIEGEKSIAIDYAASSHCMEVSIEVDE